MDETSVPRVSLRDVLVDFLGGLVPGLVFVSTSAVLVGWPLLFLVGALTGPNQVASPSLLATESEPGVEHRTEPTPATLPPRRQTVQDVATVAEAFWIEILIFTLMLSYIMGHLFYRLDPKQPDMKSFEKVRTDLENNGQLGTWVVQQVADCEFPYPNLRGYLNHRGLAHLAELVPWTSETERADQDEPGESEAKRAPESEDTQFRRTKNFVNILKIRLSFYFPEKMGLIARNEAHVRLMSSTWYMAKALMWVSMGGLVFWSIMIGVRLHGALAISVTAGEVVSVSSAPPILFCAGVFLAASLTRLTIARFLHYQRVRETVYVLETAYIAEHAEPRIMAGLPGTRKRKRGRSKGKATTKRASSRVRKT